MKKLIVTDPVRICGSDQIRSDIRNFGWEVQMYGIWEGSLTSETCACSIASADHRIRAPTLHVPEVMLWRNSSLGIDQLSIGFLAPIHMPKVRMMSLFLWKAKRALSMLANKLPSGAQHCTKYWTSMRTRIVMMKWQGVAPDIRPTM